MTKGRRMTRILALTTLLILTAATAMAAPPKDGKPKPVSNSEEVVVKPADLPPASANLMPNGDFEKPAKDGTHPLHWQAIDNLVFFWTKAPAAPGHGKVIKIDTDVYQKQAYDWWVDRFVHGKPLSDAPKRIVTHGKKYDTIGGLDGGFYWSDLIPVKPKCAIRVYIDAKGPASKVFIRGYKHKVPLSFADEEPAVEELFADARGEIAIDAKGRKKMHRLRYTYTTWFPVGGSDQWQTYTHRMPRHPNNREITEDVKYIRLMIYPYWPAATYWYDNVRVVYVNDQSKPHPNATKDDIETGKVVK